MTRAADVRAGDYVRIPFMQAPLIVLTKTVVDTDMVALGFDNRHFSIGADPEIKRNLYDLDDEVEVAHAWPEQP